MIWHATHRLAASVAQMQHTRYALAMSSLMDRIRGLILQAEESPCSIARGAGVDRSQLSRILSDPSRSLNIANAERVARYLGYDIELRPRSRRSGGRK